MNRTAVLLLNFGEPEHATRDEVVPYLERIFGLAAGAPGSAADPAVQARSRALAEARAESLIAEYELIGGSPLHAQAAAHADALATELARRGHDVVVLQGMQFTAPLIPEAVAAARAAGVQRVIALPVYPLCGPTTTIAALAEVAAEVRRLEWEVPLFELGGWHREPRYLELRAAAILETARNAGVELTDPRTRLVFSAHGTPLVHIRAGSRYVHYVRDACARTAALLDVPSYEIGYQNHANRPGVEWTQPDIGQVIDQLAAECVVVDPVSFMHEQSETLAELDHELRERAEQRGLEFYRVPIPHDSPAFIDVLADLLEPLLTAALERDAAWAGQGAPAAAEREVSVAAGAWAATSAGRGLRPCQCRGVPGAFCLNGAGNSAGACAS